MGIKEREFLKPRILDEHPIESAKPKLMVIILENGEIVVASDRLRIIRIPSEHHYLMSVVTVQAILSAEPHKATAVLMYAVNHAL